MNKIFCAHINRCFCRRSPAASVLPFLVLLLYFISLPGQAQEYDTTTTISIEDFDSAKNAIEEYRDETGEPGPEIEYFDPLYDFEKLKVETRRLPDSVKNAWKSDDAFWYADGKWKKPPPEKQKKKSFISTQWFRDLLWGIMITAFVIVLIWFLAASNVHLFRRKQVALGSYQEAGMSENIFEINYGKEIHKAIQAGNYRLAVRLMFLQMLKNLAERNVIRYQQDHTNLDYLLQLQSTAYYHDFFRITRNYEYTWYGKFILDEDQFRIVKKDFEQFEKKLN